MTGQKEHCDHECVCPDYKAAHSENGEEECYGDPEPCKLSCYHRSKTSEPDTVKRTSDVPKIIPPLPEGDMKDLKTLREYWVKHDASVRNTTLDDMIKLSMIIEENETERWEQVGRPQNDGYINGSHSGYSHALRDMRQYIKRANGRV
jgi:hypothetical protein